MILREFQMSDVHNLQRIANDVEVSRYLSKVFPSPYTEEDAKWWVDVGSKNGICKAIEVSDTLVGCIGLTPGKLDYSKSAELGYWIGNEHWGRGIATRAIREFTEYVFENSDYIRLFAPVFHPNRASMRVLEKNGYEKEGIHKMALFKDGKFYDSHVYAIIKNTFSIPNVI